MNIIPVLLVGMLKTLLTQKLVTVVTIALVEEISTHTTNKVDDKLVAAMKEAAGVK
ncbi:hypothetical protein [Vreelandella sulfidaeris]|uniref:Uncharacterized protein n=1 Tax=Vreelandella sulfidaeris TaxID=115553 RepID=A0A455U676_9GAMM|nr:hypothetical protein HSBAA_29380 [Halomonas sulfidaeris]